MSLSCGLCTRIDSLCAVINDETPLPVLSYSIDDNGLEQDQATHFLHKGKRRVVQITLEDSTTLEFTPEHRMYTTEKGWMEAKNTLDETYVIGPTGCFIDLNDDLGVTGLKNLDHLQRELAFYRILGYLLTDGNINEKDGCVIMGTTWDADDISRDIEFITGIQPPRCKLRNVIQVYLPETLHKRMIEILDISSGKRMMNYLSIVPEQFTQDTFPLPYLREFLAGLFGGNGGAPRLVNKGRRDMQRTLYGITFSQSKDATQEKALRTTFDRLKKCLGRFNIDLNVRYRYRQNKRAFVEGILHIKVKSIVQFHDLINYRYCAHKTYRTTAIVSYLKYRSLSKDYLDPEQYLNKIGALSWFTNDKRKKNSYACSQYQTHLNVFKLKVIDVRELDVEEDVYDIQVSKNHNFLANGAVVHNCIISHGGAAFLRDRLFDNSDAYETYVCNQCGLIAIAMYDSREDKYSYRCSGCGTHGNVSKVPIPFAGKLLFQELMSMGIAPRIYTKMDATT